MSHPLDGIEAKLIRAIAKINELDRDIREFCDRRPYSIRVEPQTDTDGTAALDFIAVDNGLGAPGVHYSLLAGEIVHQLRSSLDHLIYQLVTLNGQAKKLENSRRHQFPIFETRDGYVARSGRMIDGVSDPVRALIESRQPYLRLAHAPRHDPLWVLADLNNTDKHRIIPACVVGAEVVRARDSADDTTYADLFTFQGLGPLEDGQLLLRMAASMADEHVAADLACTISFQQVPDEAGLPPSMSGLLLHIAAFVGQTVRLFKPLFN